MVDEVRAIWIQVIKGIGAQVGWRLSQSQPIRVESEFDGAIPVVVWGPKPGYESITKNIGSDSAVLRRIADLITKHTGKPVNVRYDGDWCKIGEDGRPVIVAPRAEDLRPVIQPVPVAILKRPVEVYGEPEEPKSRYYDYLKSDQWQLKRKSMLWFAGNRCQICNVAGVRMTLDVHHRTYERIGHELPSDLFVLCRACHRTFHENGKLAKD
jgi:hypothetical protein